MNLVVVAGRIGRIVGDRVELLDLPAGDVGELVSGPGWRATLAAARVVETRALDAVTVDAPIWPRSFWLVGSNYEGRAAAAPAKPAFYLRSAASVSGPGAHVVAPEGLDIDPDAELAIVIGRTASHVAAHDAWGYVAGITGCNDLTARVMLDDGKGAAVAKSLPGFGALGASVRIVDGDPGTLAVSLTVDDVPRQKGHTDEMFASVPELIVRLTEFVVLNPGDVIATGAPAALLGSPGDFLSAGATTVVEIDGVLPLVTHLVAA